MFVTVEGVEGAGKSTLLGLLAGEFERRALPFVRTREPGGCALGARIRPLLLDVSSRVDERAELFLFLADRAQHVAETIRPALQRGAWVLCDRYADSTIAYQGYGRGLDPEKLRRIHSGDFRNLHIPRLGQLCKYADKIRLHNHFTFAANGIQHIARLKCARTSRKRPQYRKPQFVLF